MREVHRGKVREFSEHHCPVRPQGSDGAERSTYVCFRGEIIMRDSLGAPDQTKKFTDLRGGEEIERTEAAKETSSSPLGFARVRGKQDTNTAKPT